MRCFAVVEKIQQNKPDFKRSIVMFKNLRVLVVIAVVRMLAVFGLKISVFAPSIVVDRNLLNTNSHYI